MATQIAIRDDLNRRIRCARCGGELARLETIRGVVISDADGFVLERRVGLVRSRVTFGPGWRPTPDGTWRRELTASPHHNVPTNLSASLRAALRRHYRGRRLRGLFEAKTVEAICPQCASTNAIQIQMEAAE